MDMGAVMAPRLEQIDPNAVELRLLGKIESEFIRESGGMTDQQALKVGEGRIAARQVVQRGIAGIALIPLVPAPALARLIVGGKRSNGMREVGKQLLIVNVRVVDARGKEASAWLGFGLSLLPVSSRAV